MSNQLLQLSLDEADRILIPPAVCERLQITPGMTLIAESSEQGGVWLRVQPAPSQLIEKEGILVVVPSTVGDITNVTREMREERIAEIAKRVGL